MGVQESEFKFLGKNFTYIHLNYAKVKFLSQIKKRKKDGKTLVACNYTKILVFLYFSFL